MGRGVFRDSLFRLFGGRLGRRLGDGLLHLYRNGLLDDWRRALVFHLAGFDLIRVFGICDLTSRLDTGGVLMSSYLTSRLDMISAHVPVMFVTDGVFAPIVVSAFPSVKALESEWLADEPDISRPKVNV